MATVKQILDMANSQLGIQEIPANSNKVKYNTEYYGKEVSGSAYPWCAVFCWWIFKHCNASELFCGGQKVAYTPSVADYYRSIGSWYTSNPKPGDLILYKFSGSDRINHIGILKSINNDGTISVYEGNTGTSSDANGGEVMLRVRPITYVAGYGRPKYEQEPEMKPVTTPIKFNNTDWVKRLQAAIKAAVDGKPGNETLSKTPTVKLGTIGERTKLVQEKLTALGYNTNGIDGKCGSGTVEAMKKFQKEKVGMKNPDGEFTAQGTSWKKLLEL